MPAAKDQQAYVCKILSIRKMTATLYYSLKIVYLRDPQT